MKSKVNILLTSVGPLPHWKNKPKIFLQWRKTPQTSSPLGIMKYYYPHCKVLIKDLPSQLDFLVLKQCKISAVIKLKGFFIPTGIFCSKFYSHWLWNFHQVSETGVSLSLYFKTLKKTCLKDFHD